MGIGAPEPEPEPVEEQSEPLSVLSVLRLLTALEDQLGSLGPTAIKLLSKAIFYEKESNASANELLNENEYFTFFTTLEKLKGQIIARITPDIKLKAVKTAIKDLDQILTLFEEYKRRIVEASGGDSGGGGGGNQQQSNRGGGDAGGNSSIQSGSAVRGDICKVIKWLRVEIIVDQINGVTIIRTVAAEVVATAIIEMIKISEIINLIAVVVRGGGMNMDAGRNSNNRHGNDNFGNNRNFGGGNNKSGGGSGGMWSSGGNEQSSMRGSGNSLFDNQQGSGGGYSSMSGGISSLMQSKQSGFSGGIGGSGGGGYGNNGGGGGGSSTIFFK